MASRNDPRDHIHPFIAAFLFSLGVICLGTAGAVLYPLLQPEAAKALALGVFGILLCWMAS